MNERNHLYDTVAIWTWQSYYKKWHTLLSVKLSACQGKISGSTKRIMIFSSMLLYFGKIVSVWGIIRKIRKSSNLQGHEDQL